MAQDDAPSVDASESTGDSRLAVLLAMAMFVLVVDTSLMIVSISAVVRDLDATASGVVVAANVGLGLALVGLKVFLAH